MKGVTSLRATVANIIMVYRSVQNPMHCNIRYYVLVGKCIMQEDQWDAFAHRGTLAKYTSFDNVW